MIDISIDSSQLDAELERIVKSLSDLTSLWNHLYNAGLPDWFERTFETDGFGNWYPTQRDNPILRDTYRYYDSFVEGTQDTIDIRTAHQWEYGSSVEYGHYHEEGRGQLVRAVPGELVQHEPFLNWVSEESRKFVENIING